MGSTTSTKPPRVIRMETIFGDVLAGRIERPRPTLGRLDGMDDGLFYTGKVNAIVGAPTTGKSWLALACALSEASNREAGTLWLDLEDSPETLALRMHDIAWPEHLAKHVLYLDASGPWEDNEAEVRYLLSEFAPRLVVIDSAGEALSEAGADANAERDVAHWMREVPRRIADSGPGVVVIDHVPKARGGKRYASGSGRKLAGINGVQYVAESVAPFSRIQTGVTKLICAKDRAGNVTEGPFAMVTFTPGRSLSVVIAPDSGDDRMTRLVAAVEEHPGCSQAQLKGAAGLNSNDVGSLAARAERDGLIRIERSGRAHSHFPVERRG